MHCIHPSTLFNYALLTLRFKSPNQIPISFEPNPITPTDHPGAGFLSGVRRSGLRRLNLDLTMQHCRFKVNVIWFYSLVASCLLFLFPLMFLSRSELIYLPCYCVLLSFCRSVFKAHFGELSSPDDAKVNAPKGPRLLLRTRTGPRCERTSIHRVSRGSTVGNWIWNALDVIQHEV